MLQVLNNIKEALFDAPAEVKSAFNDVVNYFAEESSGPFRVGEKWPDQKYYSWISTVFKTKDEAQKYIDDETERWKKRIKAKGRMGSSGDVPKYIIRTDKYVQRILETAKTDPYGNAVYRKS